MRFPASKKDEWLWAFLLFTPIFLTASVSAFRFSWQLQGDLALELLRSRDVWGHTPFVGPFSRYGWSHPGPALFFIFSIPAHFPINPSLAVSLFSLILKWAPLTMALIIILRKLGKTSAIVFAAFANLFLIHHRDEIWTIWNPTVGLCLFVLLVIVVSAQPDKSFTLFLSLCAGSILIQSHIGFAIPVAVLICLAWWKYFLAQRKGDHPRWIRHLVVTGSLTFLLWLPPVLDSITGSGNLQDVFRFFVSTNSGVSESVGVKSALEIVSNQLIPFSAWNGRSDLSVGGMASSASVGWLAGIAFLFFFLWKITKSPTTAKFRFPLTVVGLLVIVSVPTIAQSSSPAYPYLFGWITAIALIFWTLACSILIIHWNYYFKKFDVLLWIKIGAPIFSICTCIAMYQQTPPNLFEMEAVKYFMTDLDEVVPQGPLGAHHSEDFAGIGFGVTAALEVDGRKVFIESHPWDTQLRQERMWGKHRLSDDKPDFTVAIVRGTRIADYVDVGLGWEVVKTYDPTEVLRDTKIFDDNTPFSVVVLLVRSNNK
jgi:hypothetical protein